VCVCVCVCVCAFVRVYCNTLSSNACEKFGSVKFVEFDGRNGKTYINFVRGSGARAAKEQKHLSVDGEELPIIATTEDHLTSFENLRRSAMQRSSSRKRRGGGGGFRGGRGRGGGRHKRRREGGKNWNSSR